jgi:DNA-binding transcriptional regulator YbjK
MTNQERYDRFERIKHRRENAAQNNGAMFPGSFATYYHQDIDFLLNELLEAETEIEDLLDAEFDSVEDENIVGAV